MPANFKRNWFLRQRYLIFRRLAQFSLLALFLTGPWYGYWILKGNLASSIFLDLIVFTDPYIYLQSISGGHQMGTVASIGAATILVFYMVIGGRAYCSWVCPINVVTDAAFWLRTRLGLNLSWQPKKNIRYWLLIMTLVVSALTSSIAWEVVNPITMLQRGLVFGMGIAWAIVLAVFLFDLIVSRRGWCSHLCPVGAFYGLVGKFSLIRVSAIKRQACTDCGDCFRVCPEPQVITLPLLGEENGASPIVISGDCTNCGRCIDVCDENVFHFATRFEDKLKADAGA
ncbi:MAG: quinol dehydrogenase ferredoxin subunit NapH [Gammaproteobacteria bacterium]|nr:quinol dehydrogenase ferredoxin subunit NapH [Gammaproteobacteria bacterium]